jgi:hypothetical protein
MKIGAEASLSLGTVTLEIGFKNFRDGLGVARKPVIDQQPRTEYNLQGLPKRLARWYEPKNIWAFSLILSGDGRETLEYLWLRQHQLIRAEADFRILLQDNRLSFIESSSAPTRAASGAALTPPGPSSSEYFAKFWILIQIGTDYYRRLPKNETEFWEVNFQALELEKVAPL